MMDGLKKIAAVLAFMVLIVAVAAPAMAQNYQGTQGMQGQQLGQAQQGQGQQGQAPTKDLMATIEGNSDVSMYAQALRQSGNDQLLTGQGPFMVFAPSDRAIQRDLGISSSTALAQSASNLIEGTIVQNPQVPTQESKQVTLTALNGNQLNAVKSDSQIMINGIRITSAIPASNGILVITDGVV